MAKGNFTTGAQRYNNRLHKIFDDAKVLKEKVRQENINYLVEIGYTREGISTYNNEVIGKLAYHHKHEEKK